MSIETNYSIPFIAALALREKQIQQNYRPIIAVHKWFARRPGSLFRGLLLSEFVNRPVTDTYYRANSLDGITIADPFMGGGTPLLEANRLGCNVIGIDVNPMAVWVVREEIDALEMRVYQNAVDDLMQHLSEQLGDLYKTRCPITGREDANAKYFLWVKTGTCIACHNDFDLFPTYVVAEDARHTSYVLVCPSCGDLNEVDDHNHPGRCDCGTQLATEGPIKRNKGACPHCGHINGAPFHGNGPPPHRLYAIEYYNPDLKGRPGRLFKKPDAEDAARVNKALDRLRVMKTEYVPDDVIPNGDETARLHRWGYDRFRELFNPRQLLALETAARYIAKVKDKRLRRALATNFSDLLRYQNMICRYDAMALKSLDVFSIHGFPVGYLQAESNFLGIRGATGLPVGSGGWTNITDKYAKAKRYCTNPFEVAFDGKKKSVLPISGEWIGEYNPEHPEAHRRDIDVRCASSTEMDLPAKSLDAVFTDPPYYGMVQYGELMHFCYVWLRKLMGSTFPGLEPETTCHAQELTGNDTAARDIAHFANGLAAVYRRIAAALKSGAPLVFTYHHNKQEAYLAVGMAILDAGLTCSASLPCPAEMGGSIHIHGTASSIVDTVFVCRDRGDARRHWLFDDAEHLATIIARELDELRVAGMTPTPGDIRCIAFGHITRMAIWNLRPTWDASQATEWKLALIRRTMDAIATVSDTTEKLAGLSAPDQANVSCSFAQQKARSEFDAIAF